MQIVKKTRPALTTADIRRAMLKKWAAPEYALLWEVADATGARHTRLADAVIMSLWPSRGLELHGVEIKVSKSDWRREALTPQKAEAVAGYCDRWYVHTPPGIVADVSELPPAWGLREFDGQRWCTVKEAALRTNVKPCDRAFLAAILRRSDEQQRPDFMTAVQVVAQRDHAAEEQRIKEAVEARTQRYADLRKNVSEFEEATGLNLKDFYRGGKAAEAGRLAKAIMESGIASSYKGVATIAKDLRGIADKTDKALAELGALATYKEKP